MPISQYARALSLLAFFFSFGIAADNLNAPAQAESKEQIIAIAEKEHTSGLIETPNVQTFETECNNKKVFSLWYNPYSGRAACHAYIYELDDGKNVWLRKSAKIYEGTHLLSYESKKGLLIIKDAGGKQVDSYPGKNN